MDFVELLHDGSTRFESVWIEKTYMELFFVDLKLLVPCPVWGAPELAGGAPHMVPREEDGLFQFVDWIFFKRLLLLSPYQCQSCTKSKSTMKMLLSKSD
jgi:hypothetical protein